MKAVSGMYFSGYDRAITVFSPDGRLYQVEYAMEPVRKGWATVGVRVDEGVVIVAEKRPMSPLADMSSTSKITLIDRHIGAAYAGLSPDARILVNQARVYAQVHRLTYDEDVDVELVTKHVGDLVQAYTQHGGTRPFGVALVIGGLSQGAPRLFMTDTSGAYTGYKAVAIGQLDQQINDVLKETYSSSLKPEEAAVMALKAMRKAQLDAQQAQPTMDPLNYEVGIIRRSTGVFAKLTQPELQAVVSQAQAAG
ncbi:MAG: archaeal proteasome endopeptidase complex subunit alpha [Thermoprotei archaeon]